MKAIVINRYGSAEVLEYIEDAERPQIKSNQLLVQVQAAGVNPVDWKMRQGLLRPLTGNKFPIILGLDLAGDVVAVGDKVTQFKVGDSIYADVGTVPGRAYAEYAVVSETAAALKPANFSYEEAAAVPVAGLTALQALRDHGQLQAGQKVLINGSSGGVGIFAVQIAKILGAEVTAVCSTKNLDLVKSLGADRAIDYTQQDFTQESIQYHVILDAVGKQSFSRCRRVLQPRGIYVTTLPGFDNAIQGLLTLLLPGKKAKFVLAKAQGQDLALLKDWFEAGKIRPVIDRTYPLAEAVAAHTYSETERAVGKIVLTISS